MMMKEFGNYALVWFGDLIAVAAHILGWGFHKAEWWIGLLFVGALFISAGMFLEHRRQRLC